MPFPHFAQTVEPRCILVSSANTWLARRPGCLTYAGTELALSATPVASRRRNPTRALLYFPAPQAMQSSALLCPVLLLHLPATHRMCLVPPVLYLPLSHDKQPDCVVEPSMHLSFPRQSPSLVHDLRSKSHCIADRPRAYFSLQHNPHIGSPPSAPCCSYISRRCTKCSRTSDPCCTSFVTCRALRRPIILQFVRYTNTTCDAPRPSWRTLILARRTSCASSRILSHRVILKTPGNIEASCTLYLTTRLALRYDLRDAAWIMTRSRSFVVIV